ncbi:MAG: hypothetical protein NVS3B14_23530 [Ktedonobacteraceae bacterium]
MQCPQCSQTFAGLSQSSKALDHLKEMSRYVHYPELKPEQVLAHAQRSVPLRSAWKGQSYAPKPSLRVVSIPVAFAMLLLFTLVVFVLAYALVNSGKIHFVPGNAHSGIVPNPYQEETGIASHLLSSTPPAVVVSPAPPGPTLEFCSPHKAVRIVICGSDFKPKERVVLLITTPGNRRPIVLQKVPVTINPQGGFKESLDIPACKNLPLTIGAEDITQKPFISLNTLTISSVPGCSEQTSITGTAPPAN